MRKGLLLAQELRGCVMTVFGWYERKACGGCEGMLRRCRAVPACELAMGTPAEAFHGRRRPVTYFGYPRVYRMAASALIGPAEADLGGSGGVSPP